MNAKKGAVQIGRSNTARQDNGDINTVFIIRFRNHRVKVDKAVFFGTLLDVATGFVIWAGLLLLCVLIPMLEGGF